LGTGSVLVLVQSNRPGCSESHPALVGLCRSPRSRYQCPDPADCHL